MPISLVSFLSSNSNLDLLSLKFPVEEALLLNFFEENKRHTQTENPKPNMAAMFGGRPGAKPQQQEQPTFGDLYFHQKLVHLATAGSDFVLSKVNWWIPSIAVSIAATMLMFNGPMAIAEAYPMLMPTLTPFPSSVVFGAPMPGMEHGDEGPSAAPAEDDEDDFAEE